MKRLMMVLLVVASLLMVTVGAANAGPSAETIAQLQADGAVGAFDTEDGKAPDGIQSGWSNHSIKYIIASTSGAIEVVTWGGVSMYIYTDTGRDVAFISYGNNKNFWVYVDSSGYISKYALNDV